MGGHVPLTFLLGVLMGTASAISTKVMYGIQSVGLSGEPTYFEKPLLLTAVMFLSMTFALPMHWANLWREARNERKKEGGGAPHLTEPNYSTSWRTLFLLLVPSVFDLLATALGTAGLMFTTVSVYQLIRCSVMIVTALMKVSILREPLLNFQWWGIGVNTVAMLMISAISFVPGHADAQPGPQRDPRVGVLLILLSCVVQSSQYVFEEKLMVQDAAAPLLVVGMEGVWGGAIMVLIVFPWAAMLPGSDYGGCMENTYDAWVMLTNSPALQILLFVFFLSIFLYNVFAIYVTYLLNSVWHAILENFRPGAVWAMDLALYYFVTQGAFGERWTKWSWLQLGGMLIMFLGTAIYNATVELPYIDYSPSKIAAAQEPETYFSSNSVTSSPLISRGARARRLSGIPAIQNLAHDGVNGYDDRQSLLHAPDASSRQSSGGASPGGYGATGRVKRPSSHSHGTVAMGGAAGNRQ